MNDLRSFIIDNKRKIIIILVTLIILVVIIKVFGKKEVVENVSTTSPKTGWDADYNPDYDDQRASEYGNVPMELEELEEN